MNTTNKLKQHNTDFLQKNIITYLGNKRTQLGFINDEVSRLISSDSLLKNRDKKSIKVLDIFSGSGVVARSFKHNGFGGKGKNALNRIMADMILTELPLIEAENGKSFTCDAVSVMSNNDLNVDVVYCDSPYNSHQYSGNYHLLTTAVNNRDLDVVSGKGGIRTEQNKSEFCYKKVVDLGGVSHKKAYHAFKALLDDVSNRSKYLIVSYNQEGILNQSELIDVLSNDGKHSIEVKTHKHDKFKGGKNTNISNAVVEHIFIVELNKPQCLKEVGLLKNSLKLETEKQLLLDKYINTERLPNNVDFVQSGAKQVIQFKGGEISLDCNNWVTSERFKKYDEHLFELINGIEFESKEEMMGFYIKNNNRKAALKLLSSFKIKSKRHLFDQYSALLLSAA